MPKRSQSALASSRNGFQKQHELREAPASDDDDEDGWLADELSDCAEDFSDEVLGQIGLTNTISTNRAGMAYGGDSLRTQRRQCSLMNQALMDHGGSPTLKHFFTAISSPKETFRNDALVTHPVRDSPDYDAIRLMNAIASITLLHEAVVRNHATQIGGSSRAALAIAVLMYLGEAG